MKAKKTIKSRFKVSTILILLIGGLGMIFIGYYLTTISLNSEYPQIAGLILGGLIGLIGIFSLLSLLRLETLELDSERLVVKSILQYPKKTIYLREIVSYKEIEKENKSGIWFDLTIFTQTENYKISSSAISNYQQFKAILTKGKPRNIHSEKLLRYKVIKYFGIAFVIIGSLFLYGLWNVYKKKDEVTLAKQLTTIRVTITDEIKISKSKSSRSVKIKTEEYPAFIFELSANSFYASNAKQFVANVNRSDTIEIDILTDTYEKKLIKSKPPTFWDKTVNYNFISIYGLRDFNQNYLTLHDLNNKKKSDSTSWGFWIFVLFGLGLTSSGIYLLTGNRKPASKTQHPNHVFQNKQKHY